MILTRFVLLLMMVIPFTVHSQDRDDLVLVRNRKDECAYKNLKGKVVIPFGRYQQCFSDTLKNFAFVADKDSGIIAIDKEGQMLFKVFNYDNGPDMLSDSTFRITKGELTGYADHNGNIIVEPRFKQAYPFVNGHASVFIDERHGWFEINKKGEKVKDLTDGPRD